MFPSVILFNQDCVQDSGNAFLCVERSEKDPGARQRSLERGSERSGTPKFPSTFRRRSITGSTLLDASAQPSTCPPIPSRLSLLPPTLSPSASHALSSLSELLPLSVTGLDARREHPMILLTLER